MKILAIEREKEGLTKRDFVPHLRDEAAEGWELYKDGFIREMYYRGDRPEVILVLESESLEKARQTLQKLPLVSRGLISFDLIELKPYYGFERLFNRNDRTKS